MTSSCYVIYRMCSFAPGVSEAQYVHTPALATVCNERLLDICMHIIQESIAMCLDGGMIRTPSRGSFNTLSMLRPRQSGRHFDRRHFQIHFLFNENAWTLIKISLKFVPKGPINNIPALVQTMAGRRPGDKPLSGSMMVSLLTHKHDICVTRPQWIN